MISNYIHYKKLGIHPITYWACAYLYMLGVKLKHVSEKGRKALLHDMHSYHLTCENMEAYLHTTTPVFICCRESPPLPGRFTAFAVSYFDQIIVLSRVHICTETIRPRARCRCIAKERKRMVGREQPYPFNNISLFLISFLFQNIYSFLFQCRYR